MLGNGRSKLYGNYGRYYARIPNDLAARALSGDAGFTRGDYFDANLTQPIPNGVLAGGQTQHYVVAGLAADQIDADAKLSYQDEFIAGFEYEAFPSINLGVRYIHRNVGRVLEDIADAPAVAYDLGLPGLSSVEYHPDQPRLDFPTRYPELGAAFDTQARLRRRRVHPGQPLLEQLAGARPATAGRGCSAPSRASTARTTASRTRGSPRSTTSPPTTRRSPPSAAPGSTTSATSVTWVSSARARCRSNGPAHQVKLAGSYVFPIGLSLGTNILLSSGKPLTALAVLAAYDNDSEIPLTPRRRRGSRPSRASRSARRSRPGQPPSQLRAEFRSRRLTLLADAFNIFNLRRVTDYNAAVEFPVPDTSNPDFGTPTSANVSGQRYPDAVPAAGGRALRLLGAAGHAIDGKRAGVSRPFSCARRPGHGHPRLKDDITHMPGWAPRAREPATASDAECRLAEPLRCRHPVDGGHSLGKFAL